MMGGDMTPRFSLSAIALSVALLADARPGMSQDPKSKDYQDALERSQKAAKVFDEIMGTPDKAIPDEMLAKAECVMVFPNVLKAGFIVGGRGGGGVASCRTADGWSSPAMLNMAGGSVGLQIGAQSTDFVLVVLNKKGMDKLMGDKFELGGDASVAAGPVGRQAGLSTNVRMDAEILSYSRSKGLFAGLELKGVVIKADKDDMAGAYGPSVTVKDVLDGRAPKVAALNAFPATLAKHASMKNQPAAASTTDTTNTR
jgi:SH3 domain-containing YSC84-like protein 1